MLNSISYLRHCAVVMPAENHVLLYAHPSSNVPLPLVNATRILAEVSPEVTSFQFHQMGGPEQVAVDGLLANIRNWYGAPIGELLIWRIFGAIEESVIIRLAPSRLVLIENGIATFDPPSRRTLFRPHGVDRGIARRVTVAWLPMGPLFGRPRYLQERQTGRPMVEDYRKLCVELANRLDCSLDSSTAQAPIALIVGTSLYRTGAVTREAEQEAYLDVIRKLCKRGFQVVWKPHPRADCIAGIDLTGEVCRLESAMPLELWAAALGCADAVIGSIASSALATLGIYFGYTPLLVEFAGEKKLCRKLPHVRRIRSHFKRNIL